MAKRRNELNPIDVVERAYDLDADNRTWLRNLAESVRPLIDRGHGLIGYYFDLSRPISEWYGDAQLFDIPKSEVPHMIALQTAYPDLTRIAHVNYEGLLGLQEVGHRAGLGDVLARPKVAAFLRRTGAHDFATLQTVEPGGKGVNFAGLQDEIRSFDRRTRRLWARVNAHIASARRLREAVAKHAAAEEAVLTPSGKVEHADGGAKSATARAVLREAVQRQEKARGKQRRTDPEGSTEAWTAMVSGKWSLVDRFERDGRRYLIAHRNEHTLPDPRALTPRERVIAHLAALGKPNKLIGYELGLAESTIGSHLSTIMRKLGTSSRVDLIRLLGQFGARR